METPPRPGRPARREGVAEILPEDNKAGVDQTPPKYCEGTRRQLRDQSGTEEALGVARSKRSEPEDQAPADVAATENRNRTNPQGPEKQGETAHKEPASSGTIRNMTSTRARSPPTAVGEFTPT